MHKYPGNANRIIFETCQQLETQKSKNSDSHNSSFIFIISSGNAALCRAVDSFDDTINEDSDGFDPEEF